MRLQHGAAVEAQQQHATITCTDDGSCGGEGEDDESDEEQGFKYCYVIMS